MKLIEEHNISFQKIDTHHDQNVFVQQLNSASHTMSIGPSYSYLIEKRNDDHFQKCNNPIGPTTRQPSHTANR
uniref:Uncharacterized protein n=1 Tax=Caenorhabditis tropicalis TaxID=1561998 RepID=A0A1I7UR32_9PELO